MITDKTAEIVSFLETSGFQVAITPQQIVFKKGKKLTFDLESKELYVLKNVPWKVKNTYPFSRMTNFELITTEQYADATPFQDGHKEFVHSVRLNFENGKKLRLFSFVDRNPSGNSLLTVLMDLLRRVIA